MKYISILFLSLGLLGCSHTNSLFTTSWYKSWSQLKLYGLDVCDGYDNRLEQFKSCYKSHVAKVMSEADWPQMPHLYEYLALYEDVLEKEHAGLVSKQDTDFKIQELTSYFNQYVTQSNKAEVERRSAKFSRAMDGMSKELDSWSAVSPSQQPQHVQHAPSPIPKMTTCNTRRGELTCTEW